MKLKKSIIMFLKSYLNIKIFIKSATLLTDYRFI